jgi:hypothetical protein
MRRLEDEALVLHDGISLTEVIDSDQRVRLVLVRGRVACRAGVLVSIEETLRVRPGRHHRLEIQTRFQHYHAWVSGDDARFPRDLVRYDNAHGRELHRHVFDGSGRERRLEPVARSEMPAIDEFIREAIALAHERPH